VVKAEERSFLFSAFLFFDPTEAGWSSSSFDHIEGNIVYVVVGLGNPGKEYAATRHNIGFIFLDYLVEKLGLAFKGTKWQAETVKDLSWGYPVLFVKP